MEVDVEKLICSLLKQVGKTGYKLRMSNLIKALKEQGLEYNDGKLTQIENEPKFKVGQTIIYKGTENIAPTKMTISDIAKGQYWDDNCCIVPISDQDNWELEKPSTIKFEPELSEFEDRLGEIVIPTWDIAKGCEECKGDVEDVKKWAKELLDIAHRQFSKEEANNDTYTESELCLMSPYQLCKILEGHSDRIKIGDNYADLANGKKTFRMYKFSRLFGSVGYDIVEFETGKKPYISYHWGLGEDPYIKEDDDEYTNIVPDEYRESVIKALIDGILKRQIKKG